MPAMPRPLLHVLFAIVAAAPTAVAADGGPAAGHAADLIRARAQQIRPLDAETARRLDRLADDVRAGVVSLGDAEAVLRIAGALAPGGVPVSRPPAAMSPQHAAALLDGMPPPARPGEAGAPDGPADGNGPEEGPTVAPTPRAPAANAAATTPAAPPAPTPGSATTVPAAVPPAAAPHPDPAPTAPPRVSARVLAVERGSDASTALLAIDAGSTQGIAEGDRFAIQRQGATRVLARASKVSEDMTIALIIPGTWTDGQAEIAEGDTAISVDDR